MNEDLEALKGFIEFLKDQGFSIALIVAVLAVFALIAFPEGAAQLKRWVVAPFFLLKKWGARTYISSSISQPVSKFINNDVLAYLENPEVRQVKVKVNFISSTEELKRTKNKLVVRLNEDNDQTKNILTAASVVIPSLICPLVRSNINTNLSKAIDLTVLKKLAFKRGAHAKYVYKTSFLDPELANDPTINHHLEELIRIDKSGLFLSIFVNELHRLGENMFVTSDRSNRTADATNFLRFLVKIAERRKGENHALDFNSKSFNTSIILLAKSARAETEGPDPYLKRLRKAFYAGSESVYVIAYSKAWDFLKTLLKPVTSDERYSVVQTFKLGNSDNNSEIKVTLIQPNIVFSDVAFAAKLEELGIQAGTVIDGVVMDASIDKATVACAGFTAVILKSECSWYTVLSCANELDEGGIYSFRVKRIVPSTGSIELTRRVEADDPWRDVELPKVGDVLEVTVQVPLDFHLICRSDNGLEITIPKKEIVWGELPESSLLDVIGQRVAVKVLMVQPEERLIRASIRELKSNPWEEIRTNFPSGSKFLGTVIDKNPQFVSVEISDGIIGRVSKESFLNAGYEYENFLDHLLVGQRLSVEIRKVWVGKEKISLELSRNLTNRGAASKDLSDTCIDEHKIVKMPSKWSKSKK